MAQRRENPGFAGARPGQKWPENERPAKIGFSNEIVRKSIDFPGIFAKSSISLALLLVSQTKIASGFVRSCLAQKKPLTNVLFGEMFPDVFREIPGSQIWKSWHFLAFRQPLTAAHSSKRPNCCCYRPSSTRSFQRPPDLTSCVRARLRVAIPSISGRPAGGPCPARNGWKINICIAGQPAIHMFSYTRQIKCK